MSAILLGLIIGLGLLCEFDNLIVRTAEILPVSDHVSNRPVTWIIEPFKYFSWGSYVVSLNVNKH